MACQTIAVGNNCEDSNGIGYTLNAGAKWNLKIIINCQGTYINQGVVASGTFGPLNFHDTPVVVYGPVVRTAYCITAQGYIYPVTDETYIVGVMGTLENGQIATGTDTEYLR